MKTALDQNGSVALPEDVRARLGLRPGDEVDLEEDAGRVILRPVQTGDRGAATERGNGRHKAPEVHVEPNDTGVAPISGFVMPFGSVKSLVFSEHPGDWFLPIVEQVRQLGTLAFNWNSYGAQPIDPQNAAAALTLLLNVLSPSDPVPSIVPTSRGGVLLEWHVGGIDLEIDVRSPTWIHVAFEDAEHEEERDYADPDYVTEKLNALRSRLK